MDYIKREKLTYDEMARHLCTTKTSLYRIAAGIHYPKVELAKLISEFTGGEVTTSDLYCERPKKLICPCCGHKVAQKRLGNK
jgi:DNA-binding XRE family transcriptional regulator